MKIGINELNILGYLYNNVYNINEISLIYNLPVNNIINLIKKFENNNYNIKLLDYD